MSRKIPLIDLKKEFEVLRSELIPAIDAVFSSGQYILGSQVDELNGKVQSLLGVQHHIACGNGTDALIIALKALGVQPGDEVITTPFTFVATAETIAFIGAIPVFSDINPQTCLMDTETIESRVTRKTKAIIPVHLFGQMVPMEPIMAIAKKYELKVIEDTAQAFGATQNGRVAGTIGDIGTISYFPTKNLGAYGDAGGMITNNESLAKTCSLLANHGQTHKYEHHLIGLNSRMDTFQAAILNVKIKYLTKWNAQRAENAELYKKYLDPDIETPVTAPGNNHIYHQYTIKIDHRDELQSFLKEKGIGTAVHYPIPLNEQPAIVTLNIPKFPTPVASQTAKRVLSLPMNPYLLENDIRYVAEQINTFVKHHS
ncbi:MAG: DegT/DnrJ/EryC1/StrS family aminotransferase [Candidatus Marinimicrobia bacterium]|nr:DegT/DnrJ/EryC1/StrS family aminotransferase [Candidatus Neomarinimicrobiota bacterium]MDD5582456.1 DegT/DnrJ/EryC1/StrS family aminotransferase [Candidatus Neomarinimicrobiota bacterium]